MGMERNGVPEEAQSALKQAYKILFREGLNTTEAIKKIKSELPQLNEIRELVEFIETSERGIAR